LSKQHSFCDKEEIKKLLFKAGVRVHFVGALGIGMRALAELSQSMGITVTGSDREATEGGVYTEFGLKITPHAAKNAVGADLVVYSLAIDDENPEIACARWLKIPMVSRAEYLAILMDRYKNKISVSGSHGKSTVCAMIHTVFSKSGISPTTLCGAELPQQNSPLSIGRADLLLCEACEYKDSFLHLNPTLSVFLNLDFDHTDYFASIEQIKSSFLTAMNHTPLCVVNKDDENLASLLPRVKNKVITFGTDKGADVRMIFPRERGGYYSFGVEYKGKRQNISLRVPGIHNAYNALAAVAVSLAFGLPFSRIKAALSAFSGIERRLQPLGTYRGNKVYYDYAHHPAEIRASITTVKALVQGPVTVIFKPHTFSRTQALFSDFVSALSLASKVLLLDICAIRENEIEGVSSQALAEKIGEKAKRVEDCEALMHIEDADGAIIVMGAANMDEIIREISENAE